MDECAERSRGEAEQSEDGNAVSVDLVQANGARPSRSPVLAKAAEEAELDSHRQAVIVYLRGSFRGSLAEEDLEDLAQEALLEVHRRQSAGETIRDPEAFMKRVAWRDARDLVARMGAKPSDPTGPLLSALPDERVDLETRLIQRAELARAIEAVERLPADVQAVYRSHFSDDVRPREACRALGIAKSTYYLRLAAAIDLVESARAPQREAELHRELLSRFVSGTASIRERIRARRLIGADPQAAAVARQLRTLHDGVAATIPAAIVGQRGDGSILERLGNAVAGIRERLGGGSIRSEPASSQLISSPARGAGAGGAGVMAKFAGSGTVAKVLTACLVGGAATATCAVTGVLPAIPPNHGDAQPVAVERSSSVARPPTGQLGDPATQPATPSGGNAGTGPSAATRAPASPVDTTTTASVTPATTTTTATTSPIAPTTPPAQQEFGVASAATTTTSSSGGSSSSGGGGATVKQQFGQP